MATVKLTLRVPLDVDNLYSVLILKFMTSSFLVCLTCTFLW